MKMTDGLNEADRQRKIMAEHDESEKANYALQFKKIFL